LSVTQFDSLAAEIPLAAVARPRLLIDSKTRDVDAESELVLAVDQRHVVVHLE
jgi:hypothetical protein